MNISSVRRPKERIRITDNRSLDVQNYGIDNLYPQNINKIVGASGTATLCLTRFRDFIEGFGFRNEYAAAMELGVYKEQGDDILRNVSDDIARFGGFALLVNYDIFGRVTTIQHVPFENTRLGQADEKGEVAEICVHDDWSGEKERNGSRLRVTKETIRRYPIFNPARVQEQVERVGGINHYNGQIFWFSKDGRFTYPIPVYDAAVTEISTDEGLGNVKYRNVRNNFLVSAMVVTKKGAPNIDDERQAEEEGEFTEALRDFQGDTKAGLLMHVEVEDFDDKPVIQQFPTRNFDKEFSETTTDTTERIYAQFNQELFHAIRIGKLGFSGDVMRDAYEYYAGKVTTEQRMIERAFAKIYENAADESLRTLDWSIAPLKYLNSEGGNV